jgi:hypothetical protein
MGILSRRTWRDEARPLIAAVIAESKGLPEREIRSRLTAAYPWGDRKMWPYKVWCDEIRTQLGVKARKAAAKKREQDKVAGQTELFD